MSNLDAELNALCEAQQAAWRNESRELAVKSHRMWVDGAFKTGGEQTQSNLRVAFECLRRALEDVTGWKVSIDFRQRGGARCKS